MSAVVTFMKYETLLFMELLLLLVAYQILTGQINISGLLSTKDDAGNISPARIQLLLTTLAGAFGYLSQIFANPGKLPDIPIELLTVVGGSNLYYVGSKTFSLFYNQRQAQQQKGGE